MPYKKRCVLCWIRKEKANNIMIRQNLNVKEVPLCGSLLLLWVSHPLNMKNTCTLGVFWL